MRLLDQGEAPALMDAVINNGSKWLIDNYLEQLTGADVRVCARRFSPSNLGNPCPIKLAPVTELFLPDNSRSEGLPVFFEGNLKWFHRQVGVIFAGLDSLAFREGANDGLISFRGTLALIVRGPATVELAFPFLIERLPLDSENYWRDLRLPRVQFQLAFHDPDEGDATLLRRHQLVPMNT